MCRLQIAVQEEVAETSGWANEAGFKRHNVSRVSTNFSCPAKIPTSSSRKVFANLYTPAISIAGVLNIFDTPVIKIAGVSDLMMTLPDEELVVLYSEFGRRRVGFALVGAGGWYWKHPTSLLCGAVRTSLPLRCD